LEIIFTQLNGGVIVRALSTVTLVMMLSANAYAEEMPKDAVSLSEVYGKVALVGMQLSVQKRASEGKYPGEIAACVNTLPTSAFNSVLDSAIKDNLSDAERDSATAFFASSAGLKYTKAGTVQIYRAMNMDSPEPMPQFSSSEYKELETFTHTSAGEKLILKKVLEVGSARQEMGTRVQELMHSCNDKVAKR
jgi:hypothetical protein